MKILPMMSKGIVLMHEDGSFEMAPLQVFRFTKNGWTAIRVGRNMLFFHADGVFDGTECYPPRGLEIDSEEAEELKKAFHTQGKNQGLPPEEPYFQPGSSGYTDETRAWSSKEKIQ